MQQHPYVVEAVDPTLFSCVTCLYYEKEGCLQDDKEEAIPVIHPASHICDSWLNKKWQVEGTVTAPQFHPPSEKKEVPTITVLDSSKNNIDCYKQIPGPLKTCFTCGHREYSNGSLCRRTRSEATQIFNVVTGENVLESQLPVSVHDERYNDHPTACGLRGQYWIPIPKKRGWYGG